MMNLRDMAAQAAQERDRERREREEEQGRRQLRLRADVAVQSVARILRANATPDYETGTAAVDDLRFVQYELRGSLWLWRDGKAQGEPIRSLADLDDALNYVPPPPEEPKPVEPPPPSVEESLARIADELERIRWALNGSLFTIDGDRLADVLSR